MTAMHQAQDDYRLTTAEIFYHSYDHPEEMQSLVWQDYDLAPDYPELRRFLTYWVRHIGGVVHSVRVDTDEPRRKKRGSLYRMPSTAIH
jgi:uncharacterized protein Usg